MTVISEEKILQGLLDSMEDMEHASPLAKIMIYGESGVGKTVAALQVAQAITSPDKRVLYLDAVEGWVSLLNHPELKKRVTRMVYKGRSQIDAIADYVGKEDSPLLQFETVILDELSTMSKNDLDIVLAQRSKADAGKDPDVPTQPDYLSNTERMRRTATKLLKAGVNIILVSHLREDKDQRTGVITIKPAFMPKFSETLRENIHVVAYMTADERRDEEGVVSYLRALQVHPTKGVVAKTRVGGLTTRVDVDEFINTYIEWQRGDREEQNEDEIIILDEPVDAVVSESEDTDDSVGIVVD